MKSEKEIYSDKRANDILEVIMAYARLDFEKKTLIKGTEDVFDAIGAGVNMLGEELENSTISLKEKEQLLKEVHHRVKNNLQIISSLLNLQAEFVEDQHFLDLIRESKNRINSMALIHEMLYATKDFSHINFEEYIQKLFQSIHATFAQKELVVEFQFNMEEEMNFEIDRMIPIGLILNEIFTNCFKYAFPDKSKQTETLMPKITVDIYEDEGHFVLEVGDNGIGIAPDFDYLTSKSLGIQLIYLLSEQINAKLELTILNGTKYQLTF